jgi:GTPase SAR1 family protein
MPSQQTQSRLEGRPTKVVFVGDAGVGKTCIINMTIRRTLLDNSRPTVGTGFEKLTM